MNNVYLIPLVLVMFTACGGIDPAGEPIEQAGESIDDVEVYESFDPLGPASWDEDAEATPVPGDCQVTQVKEFMIEQKGCHSCLVNAKWGNAVDYYKIYCSPCGCSPMVYDRRECKLCPLP